MWTKCSEVVAPRTRQSTCSQSRQASIYLPLFPGFTLPVDLSLASRAPISVSRVSLHLCASQMLLKHIFKLTRSHDVTEMREKTAKSSGAYQTSKSTAQTWKKQGSISPRHPVGITNCST